MANKGNKQTKIGDHLLNYPDFSKDYKNNKFTTLTKGRNIYH